MVVGSRARGARRGCPARYLCAVGVPRDPEEATAVAAPVAAELPAATRMGSVALIVADLDRSLAYYRDSIGLELLSRDDGRASLGAGGNELLALEEVRGAESSHGYTGLYHFALLVPERRDLARWIAHAARDRVALTGASDHFVSEALYLRDPDHHGIEIYWDRPREVWEGQVGSRMTSLPLDIDAIVAELDDPETEPFDGLPPGTTMGHVHLKVADVPETVRFYRDLLGFGLMAQLGGSAAFLAAGGYHHHVGANSWESAGAPPPPEGSAALRHATIVVPSDSDRDEVLARVGKADGNVVRDPSGNALVLAVA